MNRSDRLKTNSKKDYYILLLSLLTLIYFTFLFLNAYHLKYDFFIIGFFRELLTIPFMLGAVVLFVFALKSVLANKISIRNYSIWSLLILTVIIIVTVGSFFVPGL